MQEIDTCESYDSRTGEAQSPLGTFEDVWADLHMRRSTADAKNTETLAKMNGGPTTLSRKNCIIFCIIMK
jgi:hypothetical protein